MTKQEPRESNLEVKKNSPSLIPSFLRIPWWASVLLAITSYCCLRYLVPQLQFTSQTLQNLAIAAPGFAPIAAIVFLLLAAVRLYDADDKKPVKDTDEQNTTDV